MSILAKVTPPEGGKEFPKLMIDPKDGEVVLFWTEGIGTTVSSGSSGITVGVHDNTRTMTLYRDFPGTVELRNE